MSSPIYPTSIITNGFLPIVDVEVDWSSEKEKLKRTFKREVLSKVEKLNRECGFDSNGNICAYCYMHDEVCSHHKTTKEVSFEEFKENGNSWLLTAFSNLDVFDFKAFSPSFYFDTLLPHWFAIQDSFEWNQETA